MASKDLESKSHVRIYSPIYKILLWCWERNPLPSLARASRSDTIPLASGPFRSPLLRVLLVSVPFLACTAHKAESEAYNRNVN